MSKVHGEPFAPGWGEYSADNWADAIVSAMKLGGVDNLFFVSGSEIAFYQEAIAKAVDRKLPAPRLVSVTHEGVALNAALGDSMVSGEPSATAAHVDLGTLNYGAAIHTAWRGSYPVLITSGTGPRAFPGSIAGARDNWNQWVQEPRDQGEIMRQYTKLDHRMEYQDNPGLIVSRLLQVAMSEPRGPVYLSVPRETAMLPLNGKIRFPTRDVLGLASSSWPNPSDARQVAKWLIKADNPCMYLAKSGRNPESVRELVRLAELLALPVNETGPDRLNFPTTHPLFGTGPTAENADVLLVFESPIPFIPGANGPNADAKVVWVDIDPVLSRYKTMEHRADLWLPVTATAAARAIYEAATGLLDKSDMNRIADRRSRLEERKRDLEAKVEQQAFEAGKRESLHPRWVAYQLGQILHEDTILLDDALSSSPFVRDYHCRTKPGTYFKSGGSSGGWGSGAAFGAKLSKPAKDVVLVTGDGYFMFGTPLAALWAAKHYSAPFLTVVLVNRSYSTGTRWLADAYPDGVAVQTRNYDGGLFDPPPDFAKLAEAANCYGETVLDAYGTKAALQRGLEHVHNGTPAVIACILPTLVDEMDA